MKRNKPITSLFCIFVLFCVSLAGCVSTERPFTKIYTGESDPLLGGTRWELVDLKSTDNFTLLVEFGFDGFVSWYNIPESYNAMLSENSTWERNGNDLVFNAKNGFYLYEGKIGIINGKNSITGRYKTGYKKPVRTNPLGDFLMMEQ